LEIFQKAANKAGLFG